MKRAYKKRKKYKVNMAMVMVLLVVLVMVAVCIGGIVAMVQVNSEKDPTVENDSFSHTESESTSDESAPSSTEEETTSEEISSEETSQEETPPVETPPAEKPPAETQQESYSNPGMNISAEPQDYSCYNGTAFLGDSRVGGLLINTQVTNAEYYYEVGLHVYNALSEPKITLKNGSKGTVADALKQGSYTKVFIQIGINDLGCDAGAFVRCYQDIINTVKQIQPSAKIYALSILPVSKAREEGNVTNENVRIHNELVKQAAQNCGVEYVDLIEPMFGEKIALPPGSSNDGLHLNRNYCYKLLNYLKTVIE